MNSMEIGNGVRLTKTSVGSMDNNAYLLTHGNDALLIDAAAEPDVLLRQLDGLHLVGVATTHRHADHLQALAAVVAATGATAYAGTPDAAAVTEATGVTCREVWDGDMIELGPVGLTVIGLVGHTPGSITLAHTPAGEPARLFTGDSLFPGGVGRTWRPQDFDTLIEDVAAKLFGGYRDDTIVHPGHGADTTLGAERPQLEEWRTRRW
jgi:glyoxylase-like metal-dependent hydrolase (beta-lactamase superfamily II)